MGETLRTKFVPPPISGLDLISHPEAIPDTCARQLDNYYVYDWGIRERGAFTTVDLPDADTSVVAFYPFTSASYQGVLVCTSNNRIYRYDGSAFSAALDTQFFFNACCYNKHIFLPCVASNGTQNQIARYSLTADTYSATSFTVPVAHLNVCWAFKNRVYFARDQNSTIYYGGVGAITGSLGGPFDVGDVFQRGRHIVFGCSWAYNQGEINDELFVVGNEAGEVLIYSGDYPEATNWQLIARLDIPAPFVAQSTSVNGVSTLVESRVIKIGQDILVHTSRGVISLAQVLAGNRDREAYFNISRKIGPVLTRVSPERSHSYPFAYFAGGKDVYVLNYENGAWSKFPDVASGSDTVTHLSVSSIPTSTTVVNPVTSTVYAATSAGDFKKLTEGATAADSGATYTWKTPFFDFGRDLQKKSKMVRVLGRATGGSVIANTAKIQVNYDNSVTGAGDSKSTTASDGGYRVQELVPPGVGRQLSYVFTKTGSASHQNEIAGFDAHWLEGIA